MYRHDRLTREEVVNAICRLESEIKSIHYDLSEQQKQIDALIAKGKEEQDYTQKLSCAKKINTIKKSCIQSIRCAMWVTYNLRLLNRIKDDMDNDKTFKQSGEISLNITFTNQKRLAKSLNRMLNTNIRAKDVLTDADASFKAIEDDYADVLSNYTMREGEDSLLAVFDNVYEIAELVCKWCGAPLKNVKVCNDMVKCDYCTESFFAIR